MAVLLVFLPLTAFFISLLQTDRTYSTLEGTWYIKSPLASLSPAAWISGDFAKNTERYVSQQIPLRETCIACRADFNYLLGAREQNDIICTADHLFFQSDPAPLGADDIARYCEKTTALADAVRRLGLSFSVVLCPTKAEILTKETAPAEYADLQTARANKDAYLAAIRAAELDAMCVTDPLERLAASGVFPFYRTDHHWNYEGAWTAYRLLAADYQQKGVSSVPPLTKEDVALYTCPARFYGAELRNFGGTLLFSRYYDTVRQYYPRIGSYLSAPFRTDDFPQREGTAEEALLNVRRFDGTETSKYTNYYETVCAGIEMRNRIIKNEQLHDGSSLLLLGDSYSIALLPLLAANFETVCFLHVREFDGSVTQAAQEIHATAVTLLISDVAESYFTLMNP